MAIFRSTFATIVAAGLAIGCGGGMPATDTGTGSDSGTGTDVAVTDSSTMDANTADTVTPPADTGPVGDSGALPNISINQARMLSSHMFEYRDFGPADCDLVEGCITAPGRRRLLRFDLETPNNGAADVYFGMPGRDDPRFEFSTCHGHRHFLGYAEYALIDSSGAEVARGHKQSFCLEDTRRTGNVATAPTTARYSCTGEQGIQAGWSDVYGRNLNCQYVDVTDVPAGNYRLRARVNVRIPRGIIESDYTDNEATVDITITEGGDAGQPDAGPPGASTTPCAAATTGLDRDCGWTAGTPATCTPGAMVNVGCNAGCVPAIGACTGDAMIRVCPGSGPCNHLVAIAANDDSCDTLCSSAQFVCPAGGMYTVMTAGYYSDRASTCTVVAR